MLSRITQVMQLQNKSLCQPLLTAQNIHHQSSPTSSERTLNAHYRIQSEGIEIAMMQTNLQRATLYLLLAFSAAAADCKTEFCCKYIASKASALKALERFSTRRLSSSQ